MIETWLDALCDVWGGISAPGFKSVRSPYLVKKHEFPSALTADDDYPIALTIPDNLDPIYSAGGPKEGTYTGVTNFYMTPGLDYADYPSLIPWYGKIWKAAAASMKLGGLVHSFMVTSVKGPVGLYFGDETLHWGFIVSWSVKDTNNSTIVAGDPSVT